MGAVGTGGKGGGDGDADGGGKGGGGDGDADGGGGGEWLSSYVSLVNHSATFVVGISSEHAQYLFPPSVGSLSSEPHSIPTPLFVAEADHVSAVVDTS